MLEEKNMGSRWGSKKGSRRGPKGSPIGRLEVHVLYRPSFFIYPLEIGFLPFVMDYAGSVARFSEVFYK